MIQWVVTSSILIIVIAALRYLLRGKLSLRLQYALWGLVLVRLLAPVSFGETGLSVGNLTQRAIDTEAAQAVSELAQMELPRMSYNAAYSEVAREYAERGIDIAEMPFEEYAETVDYEILSRMGGGWSVRDILKAVWISGIAAVGFVLLVSNICFAAKLKKSRHRLDGQAYPLPVYVSPEVDTPCLFGLLRPCIYITPAVAEDETARRHSVEHETTHFRHGDHIWALMRGVCLALHWYNPLVWIAAALSRRDAELACDEATVRRLGETERMAYGRTLIGLTCQKRPALLLTATTMTGGKRSIKERITLIAKKPKTAIYTLIAVVLIIALAVGCTFTGAEEGGSQSSSLSELAFDSLDVSEPAGVGIEIVYESDDLIVFYGDFGLFGYDLNEKKMVFDVDFIKAFGEKGSVQGEYGTDVVASADGEQVVFTHLDPDSPEVEYESYFVDVPTLTYHTGAYVAPEDIFDRADAVGYIVPGGSIGGSVYIRGEERWEIFAEYALPDLTINAEAVSSAPQAVIDYATDYTETQLLIYMDDFGCGITEAKITGLTPINYAPTADMTLGLWLLEYRFLPDVPGETTLTGGMRMDGDYITEWGSAGQPYLLLDRTGDTTYERICVTNTLAIQEEYGTTEMLERYGNMYAAAVEELYTRHRSTYTINGVTMVLEPGFAIREDGYRCLVNDDGVMAGAEIFAQDDERMMDYSPEYDSPLDMPQDDHGSYCFDLVFEGEYHYYAFRLLTRSPDPALIRIELMCPEYLMDEYAEIFPLWASTAYSSADASAAEMESLIIDALNADGAYAEAAQDALIDSLIEDPAGTLEAIGARQAVAADWLCWTLASRIGGMALDTGDALSGEGLSESGLYARDLIRSYFEENAAAPPHWRQVYMDFWDHELPAMIGDEELVAAGLFDTQADGVPELAIWFADSTDGVLYCIDDSSVYHNMGSIYEGTPPEDDPAVLRSQNGEEIGREAMNAFLNAWRPER